MLDIGCGSGGITLHIVDGTMPRHHRLRCRKARHRSGARRADKRGLVASRVSFVQAAPGRLPFEDGSFDVVFSKDAMVHIPDKDALFAEIFRVLRPGGVFAASDWLIGHDGEPSPDMKDYIEAEGLSLSAWPRRERYRERWSAPVSPESAPRAATPGTARRRARELDRLQDALYDKRRWRVGKAYVEKNIRTWTAMQKVLDSGEHCPTHLRGDKPGKASMNAVPCPSDKDKKTPSMNVCRRNGNDKKSRKASKETRQQQLIEATIDSLAKRGYSDTTLADVADGAGLSRGIVNFHFESKEKLLVATLQYMADEYAAHWSAALEKAGDDRRGQLWALVAADFDRRSAPSASSPPGAPSGARRNRARPTRRCAAPATKLPEPVRRLCAQLKAEAATITMRTDGARPLLDDGRPVVAADDGQEGLTREKALHAAHRISGLGLSEAFSAQGSRPEDR